MSVNFINAQMNQTQMAGADLTAEFKTYYQRVLLDTARENLIHQQYGQQFTIPAGQGKTTEWRRAGVLPEKTTPLQEGIAPAPDPFSYTAITVSLLQYGGWIKGTDVVKVVAFDPLLDNISEEQGDQAGRTLEKLTVTALSSGGSAVYAGNKTFATLVAGDLMSYNDLVNLRTVLEVNKAKPWKGRWYGMAMHPMVEASLWTDPVIRNLMARTDDGDRLYDHELARIMGFTLATSNMALSIPPNTDYGGAQNTTITVYQTLIFGRGAFGIVEIASLGMETIFNPVGSAKAADPLHQYWTSGWKCTFAIKVLNDAFMIRFLSAGGARPYVA